MKITTEIDMTNLTFRDKGTAVPLAKLFDRYRTATKLTAAAAVSQLVGIGLRRELARARNEGESWAGKPAKRKAARKARASK